MKFFAAALLYVAALSFHTTFAESSQRCEVLVRRLYYLQQLGPEFNRFADESTFEIRHRRSQAQIKGWLNDGVLSFNVKARDPQGRRLTESFNAAESFREMMDHFGGSVKAIKCRWLPEAGWTTNLDELNASLRQGKTLDNAIAQTWSARQAIKAGFTKMRILNSEKTTQGEFRRLIILFEP